MKRSLLSISRLAALMMVGQLACGEVVEPPDEAPIPPGYDAIVGSWVWLSACCGVLGLADSAASHPDSVFLEFGASGRLTVREGTETHHETTFRIVVDEDRPAAGTLIQYPGTLQLNASIVMPQNQVLERLTADTLDLRGNLCFDCFYQWVFVRVGD